MKFLSVLLSALLFVSCVMDSMADIEILETSRQGIIGGTETDGTPAVGMIFAREAGAEAGNICTATLISDRVFLTAAHCVSTDMFNTDDIEYFVMMGHNVYEDETRCPCFGPDDVDYVDWDPQFNKNDIMNGHDIGVLVLKEPIVGVDPMPINRNPLTNGMRGNDVRIIGYGMTTHYGEHERDAGIKRQAMVSLNGFDSKFVTTGDRSETICSGDSGGPNFMKINGVEHIIGINSFGRNFFYYRCIGEGTSTRVDKFLSFIDQHL